MAKAKSARKGAVSSNSPGQLISAEERERMIAEAAYFRAMQRGFSSGDPLDDWLGAEREISRLLPGPQQQKAEVAAYERLRATVGKLLAGVSGTVNEMPIP